MLQCWKNRTVIDSLVPYSARDEECDTTPTEVVLVPSYDEPGMPTHWAVATCPEHREALLVDLTSEEGHGYPREDLTITTTKED